MSAGRSKVLAIMLGLICAPNVVHAQVGVGTWVRQNPDPTVGSMTMTVEACCGGGRKLTYRFSVNGTSQVLTVESPFDGTEVPVLLNGKPSGETMAITLVDSRHTSTNLKMNGQPFGTSKATLSADGKTLTVVNEMKAASGPQTEIWKKQ
jgi:hypothetical protein